MHAALWRSHTGLRSPTTPDAAPAVGAEHPSTAGRYPRCEDDRRGCYRYGRHGRDYHGRRCNDGRSWFYLGNCGRCCDGSGTSSETCRGKQRERRKGRGNTGAHVKLTSKSMAGLGTASS